MTHYSSDDGLSQNTVMSILQDRKGNMWFATWDGINKFDGYTFKTYKARLDNGVSLSNNRIDYLCEDRYGFLWLLSYDKLAYRFDPRTEQFIRVPAEGEPGSKLPLGSVRLLSDGTVWLFSEGKGAIRVQTDSLTCGLSTEYYAPDGETMTLPHVHDVYEDASGNEWLMTENGLFMYASEQTPAMASYFVETTAYNGRDHRIKGKQSFYQAFETEDELFFASGGGRLWRYQKAGGQFRLLQLPVSSAVVSVLSADEQTLLLVTATEGLFYYHLADEGIERLHTPALSASPVISTYKDRNGEVWLEQHVSGSVAHFNLQTGRLKVERIAVEPASIDRSRPAFHVHEDVRGTVWVHPYGGGFSYFDSQTNTLHPFYNSLADSDWRFSNKIHTAFSDLQGNLWLSTHSKGLEKITFRSSRFNLITPEPHHYESLSNEVRALCEDTSGNLWAGLKDGKLRVYDKSRTYRGYMTANGTIARSGIPMAGNVYAVREDSRGNLWIATKGEGLVRAERQGTAYRLTRYKYSKDDIYSLSDDNVYGVYEDTQSRIWVATFGGGVNCLMRDEEGKEIFVSHRNNLKGYPIDECYKARYITGDGKGNIWIGTTAGALMVREDFATPEEADFKHYVLVPDEPNSLSNNDVHWIVSTKNGELYLATFGGGLNKLIGMDEAGNAKFCAYDVENGLPSDVLLSIREDKGGNLWISSESGISKFNPIDEKFENYSDKSISFRVRFSEAASEYTSQGDLIFGVSNGIFYFHPDSIGKSDYLPPIVFSKLLVSNRDIQPGRGSLLEQSIDDTEELRLSHKENVFTLQYAALDYSVPAEIQYAYILEGFEKEWNYVGEQRTATYTNLPKGKYRFKVRSTNAGGVWVENTRALDIVVKPSFWETPVAYCLYVLLFILVMTIALYFYTVVYRLKHKVYLERQMTDMKLRFFTDISHELRTPLTLIAGPVEYVLEHTPLPADAHEQLKVVERNTNRMLHLINQILDFRKIQNKKMRMQVQRVDVVAFSRKVMSNFYSLADEHRIDFLFETEKDELYLWVDVDKFEKILFNLLSNAFKYTPDGKMITVFISEDETQISIGVQDQGIGIAESKRKSIFLRFENLVNNNLFNHSGSTGIGLSLVKEMVDMHKAVITVNSHLGEGSCFKVDFQKGKDHYDDTVEFLQDDTTVTLEHKRPVVDHLPAADEDSQGGKGIMLLVEDNSELRLFLRSVFMNDYCIVEAENGMEGWIKALKYLPDIIISDVMMPEKDGIAMTRELRADMTTSHIPIILLTAKTSIESQIEGLDQGADAYITKPFSASYLEARVKNLLSQRRKLQAVYRENLMPVANMQQPTEEKAMEGEERLEEQEMETPGLSPNDRKFMDKLVELMEKNMDNGELVVDDLVKELLVSRSVFFKKLKMLTGLAPIEFIKEMRINRAAQLIETGEYTMTQISYMVGINDPRYFSKCFKQKMGMTPTEYRDSKAKVAAEDQSQSQSTVTT